MRPLGDDVARSRFGRRKEFLSVFEVPRVEGAKIDSGEVRTPPLRDDDASHNLVPETDPPGQARRRGRKHLRTKR